MYEISVESHDDVAEVELSTNDGYEVTNVSSAGGKVRVTVSRAASKLIGRSLTINGTSIIVRNFRYDRGELWVESADTGDWMKA